MAAVRDGNTSGKLWDEVDVVYTSLTSLGYIYSAHMGAMSAPTDKNGRIGEILPHEKIDARTHFPDDVETWCHTVGGELTDKVGSHGT